MNRPRRSPVVTYIFPVSHHFRAPFHELVRNKLAQERVEYVVSYCDPFGENLTKRDTVDIPWGHKSRLFRIPGTKVLLQFALNDALGSDLVIVQQENRLIINYVLGVLPKRLRPKLALFGHGRNFQSRDPGGWAERWKRLWSTRCDWWFAYTEETRKQVECMGFPPDQITVFNNSVDTGGLRDDLAAVTAEALTERRKEFGLVGESVGLYVGGLYGDKRLGFLVHAAELVRDRIPNFELLVIGGGPSGPELRELAAVRPWIKLVGPRFGRDKAELMSLGKVFLMPGLVGLAILDAGVAGLPMITTAFPYHSPEIAYLENGRNGLIVQDWENPQSYADAVADLLSNPERLGEMSCEAQRISSTYTIEAMAQRFADGVLEALRRP